MDNEKLIKEFNKYLDCKLELYTHFVKVNNKQPVDYCNEAFFKEEFTFDNWLKGKIGQRLYKTGFNLQKPKLFNQTYNSKNKVLIGYEYSIYRFVNYNFKAVII